MTKADLFALTRRIAHVKSAISFAIIPWQSGTVDSRWSYDIKETTLCGWYGENLTAQVSGTFRNSLQSSRLHANKQSFCHPFNLKTFQGTLSSPRYRGRCKPIKGVFREPIFDRSALAPGICAKSCMSGKDLDNRWKEMITDCSNSRLPASTGVGYLFVELLCMNSWQKLL